MANKKSSKKDLRRTAKRTVRNKAARTALKTYVKKVRIAPAAEVVSALTVAQKMLDKAVQRGIIHKNQAARRKSRIAKAANKAAATAK